MRNLFKRDIYKPLNANKQEFRILLLNPGTQQDPLRASLRNVFWSSDDDTLEYETISYCWGDHTRRSHLRVNGVKLPVPASCAAALRRMRLPDRARPIWIDAVCINQSNLDERSQQVAMMADIYSKSLGNLIYLGEGDETTASALKTIDAVYEVSSQETNGFKDLEGTAFGSPFDDMREECEDFPMEYELDHEAWNRFFSLPWF
jgi:hypothetical protein